MLRIVRDMELEDCEWQDLEPGTLVYYRPSAWQETEVYLVARLLREDDRMLLEPRYTVIPVSLDKFRRASWRSATAPSRGKRTPSRAR